MSSVSNLVKTPSVPTAQAHSPAAATSNSTAVSDSGRRPAQNPQQPAPRKTQGHKKQHRNLRRPLLSGSSRTFGDDDMTDMRAANHNTHSRRGQTSITHLLDRTLPPRPYADYRTRRSSTSRSYRRNPTWGPGSGYHAFDKAHYVHANYRFVVSPRGDYRTQAADADEYIDWTDVMQVIASSESQSTSCPICLSEPVAPRMAKCGHIFCLPCILRLLHTSSSGSEDKAPLGVDRRPKWKKCPICDDSIYIVDLRPVRFYAGQESPLPRPGDDVVLRLMVRQTGSTLALPKETDLDVLNGGQDVPWHFAANILDYARIMKGTAQYMTEQYDGEIEALIRQEKEDELMFGLDTEWTQRAIKSIMSSKEKVAEIGGPEMVLAARGGSGCDSNSTGGRNREPDFHFYAAQPHLYLSPLDIRILKTQFGAFSSFPSACLPRVEHISTGHALDEEMRNRAKYLGHLPLGCNISFLECDWTDIVPAEILERYSAEIERRRKRNRDKATQEERERQQADRLEAAAMRGARRTLMMPATEEEVMVRFGGDSERAVNPDDFIPLGSTTPPMPRKGFSQLAGMSTSPSSSKTVWGTPAIRHPQEEGSSASLAPTQEVDDGWLKDDAFLETFSAADVAAQMEALGVVDAMGEATVAAPSSSSTSAAISAAMTGPSGGSSGKKKKKQKITLMSTGGRRGI